MKDFPLLLPHSNDNSPHVVIEVNHNCNIKCTACYKNRINSEKTFNEVKKEIDFAIEKRNLDLITFAGGEPTLHPKLDKMIEYVNNHGINASMLTNGTLLTDDNLNKYKKAGIDLIYLHIDSGQKRPDFHINKRTEEIKEIDLNDLRDKLFDNVYKYKILSALSTTLTKSKLNELKDIMNYVLSSKKVKGLLITAYQDHAEMIKKYIPGANKKTEINTRFNKAINKNKIKWSGNSDKEENISNIEIENYIYKTFKLKPDFYLRSNLSKERKKWLLYTPFIIHLPKKQYKMLSVSSNFRKIILDTMKHGNKNNTLRVFFKLSSLKAFFSCIISGLVSLNFIYYLKMIHFLVHLFIPGSKILMKDLVFQEAPVVNDKGELEYCFSCPDATVRDNEFIPVCIADFVKPIKE